MRIIFKPNRKKCRPSWLVIIFSALIVVVNVIVGAYLLKRQEMDIASLDEKAAYLNDVFLEKGNSPEGVKAEAARFISSLPTQDSLTDVLGFIFASARGNHLRLQSGDYGPEEIKDTRLSIYSFTFPVVGRYRDIKNFIHDMESSDYSIAIDALTLTKGHTGIGNISLNIKMSVLYR